MLPLWLRFVVQSPTALLQPCRHDGGGGVGDGFSAWDTQPIRFQIIRHPFSVPFGIFGFSKKKLTICPWDERNGAVDGKVSHRVVHDFQSTVAATVIFLFNSSPGFLLLRRARNVRCSNKAFTFYVHDGARNVRYNCTRAAVHSGNRKITDYYSVRNVKQPRSITYGCRVYCRKLGNRSQTAKIRR